MKNLKEIILEKLVINKDSKLKNDYNEKVLILDLFQGCMNSSYDLKLLITGLENIQKDNDNPQDLFIIKQKENFQKKDVDYLFNLNNTDEIKWQYTTEKYKMSNLLLYAYNSVQAKNNYNVNILNKFINELKEQKIEHDYIRFLMSDHYFRYLYAWYSKSLDAIVMYFSDEDYDNLLKKGIFND